MTGRADPEQYVVEPRQRHRLHAAERDRIEARVGERQPRCVGDRPGVPVEEARRAGRSPSPRGRPRRIAGRPRGKFRRDWPVPHPTSNSSSGGRPAACDSNLAAKRLPSPVFERAEVDVRVDVVVEELRLACVGGRPLGHNDSDQRSSHAGCRSWWAAISSRVPSISAAPAASRRRPASRGSPSRPTAIVSPRPRVGRDRVRAEPPSHHAVTSARLRASPPRRRRAKRPARRRGPLNLSPDQIREVVGVKRIAHLPARAVEADVPQRPTQRGRGPNS